MFQLAMSNVSRVYVPLYPNYYPNDIRQSLYKSLLLLIKIWEGMILSDCQISAVISLQWVLIGLGSFLQSGEIEVGL